jgi:hypothetical protein
MSMHNADDIVHPEGADRHTPGSMTRLEVAEQKRTMAIRAELERHQREMDRITIEFRREMTIA